MQFRIMTQTSFDSNLVRAERSVIGEARTLAFCDYDKFVMLLVFKICFAYVESSSLCASNDTSNLMIAFFIIVTKH